MNKSAIQRYAIWARTEMKAQVKQRAYQYGITEDGYGEANAVTIGGRALSPVEQNQRKELVSQIQRKGYEQVMEEVAYTWFNRFIALRYMEANNYLPSHIRVFSDSTGVFKPEILNDALHLDIPGLDAAKVAELIENNQTENLYRYLLLTQCNALNEALPRMFERMGGYTELLLPNNILKQDGILGRMVAEIPEEDWTDQVQIIGWLYQYYNSEYKDETFDLLKKNIKITKDRIPSATQLFTPDWIVRYMVENSLGKLWLENHSDSNLKSEWKYYVEDAEQDSDVLAQINCFHSELSNISPQEIKIIDPCMGSGHILVYAFDLLIQMYKEYGVSERDAVQYILNKNLYGLDIDERAAQLSYFAVMMKARQYDRRIFTRGNQPNLFVIEESNGIDTGTIDYFSNGNKDIERDLVLLVSTFRDAREYGSILSIPSVDYNALKNRIDEVFNDISIYRDVVITRIYPIVIAAETLARKYHVVVTNPPYMSSSGMSSKLDSYVKKHYPDSKADLYAVFMEKCSLMTQKHCFQAMITTQTWICISSYRKLREKLLDNSDIVSMLYVGYNSFPELNSKVAQAVTFILRKGATVGYASTYFDLHSKYSMNYDKEKAFLEELNCNHRKIIKNSELKFIEGTPIAYWLSAKEFQAFGNNPKLGDSFDVVLGLKTGDNEKYLRLWHEIDYSKFSAHSESSEAANSSKKKWFPYSKGGNYRKWYGNLELCVNWENDGIEIRNQGNSGLSGLSKFFTPGISWTGLCNDKTSFREYISNRVLFDTNKGPMIFERKVPILYLLGYLNTTLANRWLFALNSSLSVQTGDVKRLPFIYSEGESGRILSLVEDCILLSKSDWDSFEISWDFARHPLIAAISKNRMLFDDINNVDLAECYTCWEEECSNRFDKLKSNEEALNRIFINIFGLKDELSPEVDNRDVTVRLADRKRDVISLISFAVGCMFGRYSTNSDGLIFAGGDFGKCYRKDRLEDGNGLGITFGGTGISTSKEYSKINVDGKWYDTSFPPVADNIIPICDDDYFDNDITGYFIKWVETVCGTRALESNLKFIAEALGGKGTPREIIRNYFINDFFTDHLRIYQKCPLYWLFDSGKKNGFKALIYMHRYERDLLAKMRTDYVHEQQERYRTQLTHLADAISHASAPERIKLTKQQKKIQDQSLEIQKYEEKIHHLADMNISIDLDDGVKHNYALFADVLAKIK